MSYAGINDHELIRRAAAEPAAFDELVARHTASVLRLCAAFLGDKFLAEDVAQETFVRTWENLKRFDPQYKFTPWLFKIAINLSVSARHKRQSEQRTLAEKAQELRSQPPAEKHENEALTRLKNELAGLPDEYQIILTMRFCDRLACKEIGEIMGLTPNAVSIAIYKGKKMLLERMKI